MMDAVSSSRRGEERERERMTERGGIKAQEGSPINPLSNQQGLFSHLSLGPMKKVGRDGEKS